MYVAGAGAFKVYTNGANERLRIDSAGKVGIGTTIPTRSFDVRGDATIGIDQHSGNPGTTVGILTVRGHHVNSDSDYAQLYLANSNSSGGSTASIRANRDATSNYATSLSFFTNHTLSAGNGDERLRIGTTGQLGLSAGGAGVAATDYGTSGQVLTSGGASATATWTTPAGGGWVPLDSTTTDFNNTYAYESTNIFSNNTTYQQFRIEFYIRMQSLGKVYLYQYDSGAWQADGSNYVWANRVANGNSNAWTQITSSGAQGEIPISNNNMFAHQGSVTIWNPNLTTVQATWVSEVKGWYGFQPTYDVESQQMDYCATLAEREIGSGSPVAVDGFRLKPSASISACYVTVYGLKTA
jgi:hypothetical protein